MFLKLETLCESTTICTAISVIILNVISAMTVPLCGDDLVSNISMAIGGGCPGRILDQTKTNVQFYRASQSCGSDPRKITGSGS